MSKRRFFFRLRRRFVGGFWDPPEELRFCAEEERLLDADALREEPADALRAELADAPRTVSADVPELVFRSLAKRSVPFAAAKGSSALRFGKAEAARRVFQSRADALSVFGCGRTAPTVAN